MRCCLPLKGWDLSRPPELNETWEGVFKNLTSEGLPRVPCFVGLSHKLGGPSMELASCWVRDSRNFIALLLRQRLFRGGSLSSYPEERGWGTRQGRWMGRRSSTSQARVSTPAVGGWSCWVKGQFSAHPMQMSPPGAWFPTWGHITEYWSFENNWPTVRLLSTYWPKINWKSNKQWIWHVLVSAHPCCFKWLYFSLGLSTQVHFALPQCSQPS